MWVNPGIEDILGKLTLRILLSNIGPQNFGKEVYINEDALRFLNLEPLDLFSTSTLAYLKILNSELPVDKFDICRNKHGYYLKLISEKILMWFDYYFFIIKNMTRLIHCASILVENT